MSENDESTKPKLKLNLAPKAPEGTPPGEEEEMTPRSSSPENKEETPSVDLKKEEPVVAKPIVKPAVASKPAVKPLVRPGIARPGIKPSTSTGSTGSHQATPVASTTSSKAETTAPRYNFSEEEPKASVSVIGILLDLVAAGVAVAGAILLYQEFLK